MALTVLITSPTLGIRRCGADESDAAWVPEGIWWESQIPGGWKGAGFNLRQRIDQDLGLRLLDEVEIIDEHGQTMYEGRIVKLPRQHSDDYLLGVECLGWAAHLLDDPSVPYFYVDGDMSNWLETSLARRAAMAGSGFPQGKIPVSVTQGGIVWNPPNEALPLNEHTELFYAAPPGQKVAKVGYKGARTGTWTNFEAATVYTDDTASFPSASSTALTLDDTVREATVTPERYALIRAYVSSAHTPAAGVQQRYTKLAVHGNHGLTPRAISGEPNGYHIDDMLVHALNAGAPLITAAKATDGGLVDAPGVVVAHATDNDLGTVERIVLDLNKYVLFEWGVFDRREFFYRETTPDRLCWEARLDQGVHLTLEGDDAEHALNGMLVRYSIGDGTSKIAGPTGSGLDVESDLLADTDAASTVNQHNYTRKWGEQSIQFPVGSDDLAVVIGAAYLAQSSLPARSGDITLGGVCGHPSQGLRPSREVRAGDWITLSDHPTDVQRRIIGVRHTDDDGKTVVSVGNDINRVDAILEQLGVVTRLAVGA